MVTKPQKSIFFITTTKVIRNMTDDTIGNYPVNVEDHKSVPMDSFTIETLEDDHPANLSLESDGEHDQLPNVDVYKSDNNIVTHGRRFKRIHFIILAVITVVLLTIVMATSKNKKEPSDLRGRTKEVQEFLFQNEVSTMPQLQDVGSPQQLAAAFVADGDALRMPLTTDNARRFVERYVLVLLYYNFGGTEWLWNLKFLSGRDHCEWFDDFNNGRGDRVRLGVVCNEDGYVVALNLAWNNLKGTGMPREIGYLAELENLHMHYNELGGYFPESFRYMTNLKEISLMKSGMIGSLPDWIGEMTQLTSLAVGDNNLHGTIPESIQNLRDLKLLGLDGNGGLSGSIEALKTLSNLEQLFLESNALTGDLHSFNWPKLLELDVSNNALDGSVPVALFNHETLQILDIHGNMMFGSFPNDIFENTKLELLAAHNAGFSGPIPDRLAFLKSLRHLDISYNGLTGTITDTLTQMTSLKYLATSGNHFGAQSMLDLGKLTNLEALSMMNNNIIGKIPSSLASLTNLEVLDLDANMLTGRIPSWIGRLSNLDALLLNRNALTGAIPSEIVNLGQLQVLLLDGNSLVGNANAICDNKNLVPTVFTADCYPGQNGESPEIRCTCCTQCCTDDDTSCNDKKWTSDVDPSWEHGYRAIFSFSLDNAPVEYAKDPNGNR